MGSVLNTVIGKNVLGSGCCLLWSSVRPFT